MVQDILVNSGKVLDMEMAKCCMRIAVAIRESLHIMSLKGKAVIIGMMGRFIWGNGRKVRCMDEGLICGLMDRFIVENFCVIEGKGMGS